ncbi:histone-like nucleoid-structuring protein Lsr2 [Mycobacterium sp. smrl_JER01]|uniref:histone-like nucleoid-structuring protein Lsr2 n=1 Tax=Mycobacterium sp. smrl_JER01 TaxID=3402633 RepID=UPI003AC410B7
MGKIVTIEYVDDLDNVSVDPASVDTVDFSYRGKDYSLVLTAQNGAQFDKDIARYIRAAKKAQTRAAKSATRMPGATSKPAAPQPRTTQQKAPSGTTRTRGKKTPAVAAVPERNRAIREWAKANGHVVSPRGRISQNVIDAYDAAH